MSTPTPLETQLRSRRESLIRQTTRSFMGTGIAGFLGTACQVYYMLPVAGAAAFGFDEAKKELARVEAEMTNLGMRLQNRDVLINTLYGATQKIALTTVTLGHDEAYVALKTFGLAPHLSTYIGNGYNAVFRSSGLLEGINKYFNAPVDVAKQEMGKPKIGDSMTMPQIAVIGGAAAAVDYGTNRAGEIGRQIRTDLDSSKAIQRP